MKYLKLYEGFLGKPDDSRFSVYLDENNEIFLVDVNNEEQNFDDRIGFIHYRIDKFRGEKSLNIVFINVNVNMRGKKIGDKIMIELNKIAKDNNCYYQTLEVLEKNTIALNLYKKHNFTIYDKTLDFLFMNKKTY